MVRRSIVGLSLVGYLLVSAAAQAQERIRDVIYAKSGGAAFTMDVFKPKAPNGAAVIYLVSGGWFSSHESISPQMADGLNALGFTVFEVVHGSQPKYKIPEIAGQISRAVRFVRANASSYGVDPTRIGLTGASAGGHLSLLTAGKADGGDPNATDPVDREPNTVAAVVAYFPPTDFTNFGGKPMSEMLDGPEYTVFRPAFALSDRPTKEEYERVAKELSPINYITAKFPPTLLIHGDKDTLVPLQQSEIFRDALVKAGVVNELLIVKGGGHDAVTVGGGMLKFASWFSEKLAKPK
jgi:acetyl esterase/lipase